MAVDRDPFGHPEDDARDHPDEVVARAAGTLREITDAGWVRAREAVLERVRRTLRPAPHVAGRHAGGRFTVATLVLVDRLRRAVDTATPARVLDVQTDVGPDAELAGVALRLSVAYGSPVAPDAAAARAAVLAEVERTLGTPWSPTGSPWTCTSPTCTDPRATRRPDLATARQRARVGHAARRRSTAGVAPFACASVASAR